LLLRGGSWSARSVATRTDDAANVGRFLSAAIFVTTQERGRLRNGKGLRVNTIRVRADATLHPRCTAATQPSPSILAAVVARNAATVGSAGHRACPPTSGIRTLIGRFFFGRFFLTENCGRARAASTTATATILDGHGLRSEREIRRDREKVGEHTSGALRSRSTSSKMRVLDVEDVS
jgi:hypothetical protein